VVVPWEAPSLHPRASHTVVVPVVATKPKTDTVHPQVVWVRVVSDDTNLAPTPSALEAQPQDTAAAPEDEEEPHMVDTEREAGADALPVVFHPTVVVVVALVPLVVVVVSQEVLVVVVLPGLMPQSATSRTMVVLVDTLETEVTLNWEDPLMPTVVDQDVLLFN